jgi:hypothetical protein
MDPDSPQLIPKQPPKKKRPIPATEKTPAKARFELAIEEVDNSPAWVKSRDGADEAPLDVNDITFEFVVTTADVKDNTNVGVKLKKVTDSLAVDNKTDTKLVVIHANNTFQLKDSAGQVITDLRIHRTWRVFRVELDPANPSNFKAGADYEPTGKDSSYQLDGIGPKEDGLFADIPGVRLVSRPTENARYVYEFLVGWDKHPELGAMAYIIVIDVTPTQYRIRQSKAFKLDDSTWKFRTRIPAGIAQFGKDTKPEIDPDDPTTIYPASTGWQNYSNWVNKLPP